MKTEITYCATDNSIRTVYAGVFPSEGRYFRRKMVQVSDGFFSLEISLPAGINYYQLFANEDFKHPIQQSKLKTGSHSDKEQLMVGSEIFFPILFENKSLYIRLLDNSIQELRAVTMMMWIKQVSLVLIDSYEIIPFNLLYTSCGKKYWIIQHQFCSRNTRYVLMLEGNREKVYLHKGQMLSGCMEESACFESQKTSAVTNKAHQISGPGYQILPDRFAASASSKKYAYFDKWGDQPTTYSFFGGDLKGIIEKLPNLKNLGINFLYLNPLFESMSYHRYDCIDYFAVDHRLGTKAEFLELVKVAHELEIKVIVDVCINHCGSEHPFFKSVCEFGEKSIYAKWFEIERFNELPNELIYHGWQGRKELPQFNFNSPEVLEYFTSVLEYWTVNYEIDGWRFDVSSEIPSFFLKKLFDQIRQLKPFIYLIGENWCNGYTSFIEEAGGSAITNFLNNRRVFHQNFMNKHINVKHLADCIFENIFSSPYQHILNSWNFLSNHDTSRFYGALTNKRLYKNALALMFILPGIPVVYYGEENDMDGISEIENRRTLLPDIAMPTRKWIKELSLIRKEYMDFFNYGRFLISEIGDLGDPFLIITYALSKKTISFYFNFSNLSHSRVLGNSKLPVKVLAYDYKVILSS